MKRTMITVAALLLSTGVASAQTMAMDVVFVDGAVAESLTGVGKRSQGLRQPQTGQLSGLPCEQRSERATISR